MDDWPLVGRAAEAETGLTTLAEGRSVVITGEAGVGKSRLAAAVAEAASATGARAIRVVGSESAATIPFGALAPLMPVTDEERDALSLLRTVQESLQQEGSGRVLVWVEDAQLLDAGSATLVQQLVVSRACQVLATVRRGPACPDAIEALWRDGDAELVELGALDVDAVHELLQAALGPPVSSGSSQQLWQRSQGNPLYLREMVRAAVLDGTLTKDSGAWWLTAGDTSSMRLVEYVRRRLDGLDESERSALEFLALADLLSIDLVSALVPAASLPTLEERGLVSVSTDGKRTTVRFAHPVYGEVVRSGIAVTRRREHHRTLGSLLQEHGARRREDVLRIATWYLDLPEATSADVLLRASTQAQWRFDLPLAERFARLAIEAGAGPDARVAWSEAVFRQGRIEEADAILREATLEASEPQQIAEVADAHAHVLTLAGRPHDAWQVLSDASARVPPEVAERLNTRAAVLSLFAGRVDEALAAVQRILDGYDGDRSALPALIRVRCDYVSGLALALAGQFAESATIATDGYAYLKADPRPRMAPEQSLIARVVAHLFSGRLELASADAAQVERGLVALGDAEGEATGALLQGRAALARGDCPAAAAHFSRGSAANRTIADGMGLRWTLAGEAMAAALLGDAAQAEAAVKALEAVEGEHSGLFEADLVERGRAWAEVAAGRYDSARIRLAEAAVWAAEVGQAPVEGLLRFDLLRLGDRAQAPRLVELCADASSPWAGAVLAVATARGGEDWDTAGQRFEAAGALVEAMECLATAAGLYRAEGEPRRATSAAHRLEAMTRRCPGVRTPGLVVQVDSAVPLTAREREIAELAARQLPAQEIAERLFLSRRTVENHLQRIYTKLGVSSRAELAESLERAPGPGPT